MQAELLQLRFKRQDFEIEERLERVRIAAPEKYDDLVVSMIDVQERLLNAQIAAIERLQEVDSVAIARGTRSPDHNGDCSFFTEE